ncbi:MAG: glycosyltransferase family 4 protein [Alphaproteobacteria bacterium]|nr:glycosyltransferase family 4 protein [Alphaproteobacteria bacterium]
MRKLFICRANKPLILWIDHSLGGGTEAYSKAQFQNLKSKYQIIRVQFWHNTNMFHVTDTRNNHIMIQSDSLNQITEQCHNMKISEIVVNNLVGYNDSLEILQWVKHIKHTHKNAPRVSFRLHDFQCICPSFNLIDNHGKYCGGGQNRDCETCWKHKRLSDINEADKILKSGADKICDWRCQWRNFLDNTADDIIAFSESSANLLTSIYPTVAHKINIIPHTVKSYPYPKIKPHDEINIIVLGNISYPKGANVIKQMASELHKYQNVNIVVVGKMPDAPENILVHGSYNPKHLPNIMQKYNADIVFISSIWPETFSYTTSEAMSMGLAVACYNMGAPAERIKNYTHGLVLDKIDPSKNLMQIIQFAKSCKETP